MVLENGEISDILAEDIIAFYFEEKEEASNRRNLSIRFFRNRGGWKQLHAISLKSPPRVSFGAVIISVLPELEENVARFCEALAVMVSKDRLGAGVMRINKTRKFHIGDPRIVFKFVS